MVKQTTLVSTVSLHETKVIGWSYWVTASTQGIKTMPDTSGSCNTITNLVLCALHCKRSRRTILSIGYRLSAVSLLRHRISV